MYSLSFYVASGYLTVVCWLLCRAMFEQTSFGGSGRVLWRVLLGVLCVSQTLSYSNCFVLVPKNDNLIPDLTLTILLRCFAAAGILPLSRTAYQGAYI